MKEIPVSQLVLNELTESLYKGDESVERFVLSVQLFGILEPLKVYQLQTPGSYQVVSGNRRLRAARKVGLEVVPCIVCEPLVLNTDIVRAHQEQRVKKRSELLLEVKALYERYGAFLKKGKTSDTEEIRAAREFRNALNQEIGGKHVDLQLRKYNERAERLAAGDSLKYQEELKSLDMAKNMSNAIKAQMKRLAELENTAARETFRFTIIPHTEIKQQSSKSLNGVQDNSVNLIFTSPPYFQMRDYGNGSSELGQEASVDEFIINLSEHFNDCKRVLASDGTLWVNIMDSVRDYRYQTVPEKFVLSMVERGWLLHDKQIWLKTNAMWSDVPRSLAVHEYIYIFKKSAFITFDDSWTENYRNTENGGFVYGNKGSNPKLRSIIDYRDGVVNIPTANNSSLAKECMNKGIHLSHNATFPVTLPLIAVMSCTKPGDLILDCFSGTGTTGEAVLRVGGGRRYIGYELNLDFAMQANVRLTKATMEIDSRIAA